MHCPSLLFLVYYLVVINMDELKNYGNNIIVNDYEKSVLMKCHIDVLGCQTMAEILYLIDQYLDAVDLEEDDLQEIEDVANILQERLYYMGHK